MGFCIYGIKFSLMSISSEEAKAILEPHIRTLQNCVISGLDEYNQYYSSTHHILSPHARARIIRDHIIFSVKKDFEGVNGVKISNKRGLFLLFIDEKLLLRFKKINNKMRANNYPTKQAREFSEQLSFDGFLPSTTNINVGYIANDIFTSAEKIVVVCPNNMSSNKWYLDITPNKDIQNYPVIPGVKNESVNNKPRVRLRKATMIKTGSISIE